MALPSSPDEESLYERIAQEILRGEIRQGLWLKATVDAEGDDAKARALYAKYRVAQLKTEALMAQLAVADKLDEVLVRFVRTLADKGYALSDSDGAWVLYLPSGDSKRFESFNDCRQYCESHLDVVFE